jgi:hypothetical protein
MTFPSDDKKIFIEVSFGIPDCGQFITGWSGRMYGDSHSECSAEIANPEFAHFTNGPGEYLFEVSWQPEQTGEYGRVEIPSYWDFFI